MPIQSECRRETSGIFYGIHKKSNNSIFSDIRRGFGRNPMTLVLLKPNNDIKMIWSIQNGLSRMGRLIEINQACYS